MGRFVSMLPAGADGRDVRWQAEAFLAQGPGGENRPCLHLKAQATVMLRCQRCLEPLEHLLEVDRRFVFVRDEATAQTLDAEADDEVLALPPRLDLQELLEDELIMALPLVPRHDACPMAVAPDAVAAAQAPELARAHPFAVLEALRKPPRA
jgi:uncharacterized protein